MNEIHSPMITAEQCTLAVQNIVSITCGSCGRTSSFDAWTETPITGPLPRGHYQCPICSRAFRRKAGRDKYGFRGIKLEPVPSHL